MEKKQRTRPTRQRREELLRVKVTAEQKEKIVRAAQALELDMSSWARMVLLREAGKIAEGSR